MVKIIKFRLVICLFLFNNFINCVIILELYNLILMNVLLKFNISGRKSEFCRWENVYF